MFAKGVEWATVALPLDARFSSTLFSKLVKRISGHSYVLLISSMSMLKTLKQPHTRRLSRRAISHGRVVVATGRGSSRDSISRYIAPNTNIGFNLSQLSLSSGKRASITVYQVICCYTEKRQLRKNLRGWRENWVGNRGSILLPISQLNFVSFSQAV